ncbi:M15 family metallopeptidase [Pinibacter soli]|uniref:M15 family metallopeptidase n=1 Tax=Pinibacter soli TaxID=3044211 RepID=A0ABT6RAC7_9BACT|nr:M15 family metallopeptidase [Pinibacter soli]MDI3319527.1 M15 family metallopeptidase [Pinibacter soli]
MLPILLLFFKIGLWQASSWQVPHNVQKLMSAYPDFVRGYENNYIIFNDNSKMLYDDGIANKSYVQLLNNPDIEDQFKYEYKKGNIPSAITKNNDPGRMRNEAFFKKMYGSTEAEVKKNLVEMVWCPKLVHQKIKVTKINGIDKQLHLISAELDEHPELKEYVTNIGGTFNWRKINGSERLSMHSFGMTVDINTKFSDYWQWACKCTNEDANLGYKNRIPQLIIDIFERHGFIWGGKWYHYDTMHFEYRPELIEN